MDMQISLLLDAYRRGALSPTQMVDIVLERVRRYPDQGIWITAPEAGRLRQQAAALEARGMEGLPLYGIPFAIKDNIDLQNVPTTCACPAFAFSPSRSATVVQKLIDAGAIPLGKTNLDQFATGLNGTRSPYGPCLNAFDPAYIAGGSSSGSAVAVALGLASFALGTDTAGSGRVPAAFNNIIGLKPSCGRLSSAGVFPACRSLDTVSIFALSALDAERVLGVCEGVDSADPYTRAYAQDHGLPEDFRFGVPPAAARAFFGNTEAADLFDAAVGRLTVLGGKAVEIDFSPFLEAARLLYEGPWVAERYLAIREFIDAQPEAMDATVRQIVLQGKRYAAAEAFAAQHRLQALRRQAEATFAAIDVLVTPTAPTIYSIAEMQENPVALNSNLGYYTNFMNLLDMSAVAVPGGFQSNGLPAGITLCAPSGSDRALLALAQRFQRASALPLGATDEVLSTEVFPALPSGRVKIAVVGAHLSGLPLNHQLIERDGRRIAVTRTAPSYRLYALADGKRPGLVRSEEGAAIEVEVWELAVAHYGSFVAAIAPPLGIGPVLLENGECVQGFLCEAYSATGLQDITHYGGWRAYVSR